MFYLIEFSAANLLFFFPNHVRLPTFYLLTLLAVTGVVVLIIGEEVSERCLSVTSG